MNWVRRLGNQRGTSSLELVAVLPTLLLIFLASLELSRAWLTANIITSAVREGARVGVVTPALSGDLNNPVFNPDPAKARINQILGEANLTAASVEVTCIPPNPLPPNMSGCIPDSQVRADVTVNFETLVPLFLPMLGTASSPLALEQTAIMRRE